MKKLQERNVKYCECGDMIERHHECDICGIMIGPRHMEKMPRKLNGRTYCSHCYAIKLINDVGKIVQAKFGLAPDLVAQKIHIKKDPRL